MQKFVPTLFCLSLILIICFDACVYHDISEYICADTYTFAEDVRPIIETKCAVPGCHNGDMGPDLNWMDFDKFHRRAASGLIKYRVMHRIMPPSYSQAGPLTQKQIDAIACWSDQGALNN